jgi:hypothetical protein
MLRTASLREPCRGYDKNITPKTEYVGDIQWQIMTCMKVNDHNTLDIDNQNIRV